MKTPMQELIEQLKEERDGFLKLPPHSNIQERTENCFGSCIEIAERMLEKEKAVIMEAHQDGAFHTEWDEATDIIENAQDYYNETFNTKECYHKGKYTYNKETFECHKCGLIVPNEYRFNTKEK